ncbi:MAG: thiamine phosphate synthase [Chloroflexota bacterium]|nr:thiamine phosphate synthase [Chloroflexota bacterium]
MADPERGERDLLGDVIAAIAGGVTMVQVRAKHLDRDAFRALAAPLREACQVRGVPFIVNDRLDLALEIGADGVHLGEHDTPVDEARRLSGPNLIIGASPRDESQAELARLLGADYVGLGPVYVTGSKDDAGTPIGLAGLAARIHAAKLPAVGIGGITVERATEVVLAGADGVAVISAIQRAPDPAVAAAALAAAVRAGLNRRL